MNLIEGAIHRRVTVAMFTITAVLFGLIGLQRLNVNLLPDLSYPTLTVRTEFTGAAPSEIETLLTEPVEQVVGVVKNVRSIKSVSRTGQSDVTLQFAWGTDMDGASLEVREKLEVLQLPLEVKRPLLLRFNPATEAIVRYALVSDQQITGTPEMVARAQTDQLRTMRRFADEEIQKRMEPIAGVAAVKVSGGLEDEVQVSIDQGRLSQLNLDISKVIDRLRAENVNVSAGRIDESSQRFLVRTINQFSGIEEMAEMFIGNVDGTAIRLKDVADVGRGFKEREAIIRVNGGEAVELAVYKEGDANTVAVADLAAREIKRLEKNLPDGSKIVMVDDQSQFIRSAIKEVSFAALLGGLLAILVIYLFLGDAWSTFVISVSLPVSIIASFFLMQQLGISLNVMSLGGIALATGMVVDNAIVVLENTQRLRLTGLSAVDAATQGTREVSMAITASTLTHIAVFLPLVFVEGIAGQLFRDQALTVTFAMFISLIVALTLIPMLAALRETRRSEFAADPDLAERQAKGTGRAGRFVAWLVVASSFLFVLIGRAVGFVLAYPRRWVHAGQDGLLRLYRNVLPRSLDRPGLVLGIAALSLGLSLLLVPRLGVELIPEFAQNQLRLEIKLAPGTPLITTDEVVERIQNAGKTIAGVANIYAVSGSGARLDANPTESGENIGRFTITLESGTGRDAEPRIVAELRKITDQLAGAEVKFSRPELFSFAAPVEVEIAGFDLAELKRVSDRVAARMRASGEFVDVKSSLERGAPELRIYFDQDKLATINTTTRQAADQVVRKVRGEVATRYSFRDRKIDVLVRAQETDRASVQKIRELVVNPDSDRPLPLSAVARIELIDGPAEIRRIDQERVAIISTSLKSADLGVAVESLQAMLADEPMAAGVVARITGQSEEMTASFKSLLFALGLAVFLVYLVMASEFESLRHPFIILFSVPLALVGAIVSLYLSGYTLSIVVFIGLIMLVGIVVSNAIVLIDRVNQLRATGMRKREALIEGASARLRPIVMTTITTLFGFLPMAIGLGDGAEVRAPMAITVMGGLAVSTLLTLIVIPVIYYLLERDPVARTEPLHTEAVG